MQLALSLINKETISVSINLMFDMQSEKYALCEAEQLYMTTRNSWHQLKQAKGQCKQWLLCLMEKVAYQIKSVGENLLTNIPECFCKQVLKVAFKLLSKDEATFKELTLLEQKLWTSFETDQIYHFLIGESDTVRFQIQFDHIAQCHL